MHYLEITYRSGKPLAAYLYLPRQPGDASAKVVSASPTLKVDLNDSGRPLGIEILDPQHTSLAALNQILASFSLPPLTEEEIRPLVKAA